MFLECVQFIFMIGDISEVSRSTIYNYSQRSATNRCRLLSNVGKGVDVEFARKPAVLVYHRVGRLRTGHFIVAVGQRSVGRTTRAGDHVAGVLEVAVVYGDCYSDRKRWPADLCGFHIPVSEANERTTR